MCRDPIVPAALTHPWPWARTMLWCVHPPALWGWVTGSTSDLSGNSEGLCGCAEWAMISSWGVGGNYTSSNTSLFL